MAAIMGIHGGILGGSRPGQEQSSNGAREVLVLPVGREHVKALLLEARHNPGPAPEAVGVVPSAITNAFHQRRSVDGLLRLVPGAVGLPGCPESPRPEFPPYLESFVNAVAAFAEP